MWAYMSYHAHLPFRNSWLGKECKAAILDQIFSCIANGRVSNEGFYTHSSEVNFSALLTDLFPEDFSSLVRINCSS